MKWLAPLLLPGAALAQDFDCAMADGMRVTFRIDPAQFVTAVSPEEPIRKKLTVVQMGDATTPAEPFIIGDTRGFHAEGLGGSSIMFTVDPAGAATWANVRSGARLDGQCEVN